MHEIDLILSTNEKSFFEQKAAKHGMTVQEFIAYLIREAINQSTVKIRTMVKN